MKRGMLSSSTHGALSLNTNISLDNLRRCASPTSSRRPCRKPRPPGTRMTAIYPQSKRLPVHRLCRCCIISAILNCQAWEEIFSSPLCAVVIKYLKYSSFRFDFSDRSAFWEPADLCRPQTFIAYSTAVMPRLHSISGAELLIPRPSMIALRIARMSEANFTRPCNSL